MRRWRRWRAYRRRLARLVDAAGNAGYRISPRSYQWMRGQARKTIQEEPE